MRSDIVRALGVLMLAIPLPGLFGAVFLSAGGELDERPSETREYATITRHLHDRFDGYDALDVIAPQFGVVALSQMASGLLDVYVAEPGKRDEVLGYLTEVARRARSERVSPRRRPIGPSTALDDHNLYWSHLGLILGAARFVRCGGRVCPAAGDDDELQGRIARHLRDRSLASGVFAAPSYPAGGRWPADQTVSLVAMKLYDVTQGTSLHVEPLRGFLRTMKARRDPRSGLYPSSLSPVEGASLPRGCATSWSVPYLAQLAPDEALDQYVREREALGKDVLGVGGFREWPAGHASPWSADSGPIVLGVGVAATGLGLAGARMFHDEGTYALIRRTAMTFGVPAPWSSGGYLTAPLLGEAILFHGRTARSWFGGDRRAPPRRAPFPTAVVALLLLALAAIGVIVRSGLRAHRVRVPAGVS